MSGVKNFVASLALATSENTIETETYFSQNYCNANKNTCYNMYLKDDGNNGGNFALNIVSTEDKTPRSIEQLRYQFNGACETEIKMTMDLAPDENGDLKAVTFNHTHLDCSIPADKAWEQITTNNQEYGDLNEEITPKIEQDIRTVYPNMGLIP